MCVLIGMSLKLATPNYGPAFGRSQLHVASDECLLVDTVCNCSGFHSVRVKLGHGSEGSACATCEYISKAQVKSKVNLQITHNTLVYIHCGQLIFHSISPFDLSIPQSIPQIRCTFLWTSSVVSLLYGAVYKSANCTRFQRVFWLLFCCLLQIIIVEFPTFRVWSLDLSLVVAVVGSIVRMVRLRDPQELTVQESQSISQRRLERVFR